MSRRAAALTMAGFFIGGCCCSHYSPNSDCCGVKTVILGCGRVFMTLCSLTPSTPPPRNQPSQQRSASEQKDVREATATPTAWLERFGMLFPSFMLQPNAEIKKFVYFLLSFYTQQVPARYLNKTKKKSFFLEILRNLVFGEVLAVPFKAMHKRIKYFT